jgi:hypothetical protein
MIYDKMPRRLQTQKTNRQKAKINIISITIFWRADLTDRDESLQKPKKLFILSLIFLRKLASLPRFLVLTAVCGSMVLNIAERSA